MIRDVLGHYTLSSPATEEDILAAAEDILARRLDRQGSISGPSDTEQLLRMRLGALQHEEFHCVLLDNRHRIIGVERLASGTIDGASIHPREVVKTILRSNAAAVIFAHNHPSGVPEPSQADRNITERLRDALRLIEVRVLDHFVVSAGSCVSFAARGLL